jgi:hypothetical protein
MSAAQQTQINHEVKEQKLQKDITMTFISWNYGKEVVWIGIVATPSMIKYA